MRGTRSGNIHHMPTGREMMNAITTNWDPFKENVHIPKSEKARPKSIEVKVA
jgi:hypothetical protein